jgi:hypothetical protein
MEPTIRFDFDYYISTCVKLEGEPPYKFAVDDIINRNPEQIPDFLWHQLIIYHVVYGNYN